MQFILNATLIKTQPTGTKREKTAVEKEMNAERPV